MPITTATIISASSFNYIQTNLSTVLQDYYKYSAESFPVSSGMIVTADQWLRLYRDINRCLVHQTGNQMSVSGVTVPEVNGIVKADFCNALELASDQIVANKSSVWVTAPRNQLETSILNSTEERQTIWGSSIRLVTYHTWIDQANADAFFNLGGYLRVDLDRLGNASNNDDIAWIGLLDTADPWVFANTYNRAQYISGNPLTNSWLNGVHELVVTFTKLSNTQVKTEVNFNISSAGITVNLLPKVTVYAYYSVDRSLVDSGQPAGVSSPIPLASIQVSLETGGEIVPITVVPVRNLKITPSSLSFSYQAGVESSLQTINLENLGGNELLAISDITASQVGVTPRIQHSGAFTGYPILIPPNETYSFQIAYTSTMAGTYNNVITFTSNDTVSTSKNISVTNTVTVPVFDFSLSPASWTVTVDTNSVISQLFSINANQSFTSYVASISNYHDLSFGLNTGSTAGPRVQFAPEFLANGVYQTILSVTVNGLTKTATITMTVNVSASVNLGSWKSAAGYYNSIIGLSYDIISGSKYLTVGIGGGADGAPVMANNGNSYLSVTNLNYNADQGYLNGPALFKTGPYGAWSTFMNTYGVWLKTADHAPIGSEWYRSYTINAPATGVYNWEFSVDNYGWFTIDGVVIGDLRNIGDSYNRSYTGSVTLTAGTHNLVLYATNWPGSGSNPGAIAITLTKADDNQQIWSTLTPVRSGIPYQYWDEVYRIPLNRGAFTYQLKNYLIKASNSVYSTNSSYTTHSEFFGSGATAGSMLSITDDGFGNLTIVMNEKTTSAYSLFAPDEETLLSLSYALYYYTNNYPYTRYSNLENSSGQTRYLLGFTSRGIVVTSSRAIPDSPPYPDYYGSNQSGGGGGGDGGGVSPF